MPEYEVHVRRLTGSPTTLDGTQHAPSEPAYVIELVNPHKERLLVHEPFYEGTAAVEAVKQHAQPFARFLRCEIVYTDEVNEEPIIRRSRPWLRRPSETLAKIVASDCHDDLAKLLMQFEQERDKIDRLIRTIGGSKIPTRGFLDVIENDAHKRHIVIAKWLDDDYDDWEQGIRVQFYDTESVVAFRVPWTQEAKDDWYGDLMEGLLITWCVDVEGRFNAICFTTEKAKQQHIRDFVAKHNGEWME